MYSHCITNKNAIYDVPDSKVHMANMGPTWFLSAEMGPVLAPRTLLSGVISHNIMYHNESLRIRKLVIDETLEL